MGSEYLQSVEYISLSWNPISKAHVLRDRDTVPTIISAQWCIMIIHYEANIKTCPSPRQMQYAASDSRLNIIMNWGGDDGNMQQKWKVANDKASIILVLTWKFLLKFQENVNELLKPKPAPSLRWGMREKIRLLYHHWREEREVNYNLKILLCYGWYGLDTDRTYFSVYKISTDQTEESWRQTTLVNMIQLVLRSARPLDNDMMGLWSEFAVNKN